MVRAILMVPSMLLFLLSVSLVVALPAAATSPGGLDATFGTGGKVITPFDSYTAIGQSVAIQPSGKIVVGGVSYTTISTGDFALARYNTDGTLDPTFGSGTGKVTTSFGSNVATVWSVAIYNSGPHLGKIVAAGDSTASGLNVFALARYNTDGSLDITFGGGTGKVTTSFALPGDVNVTAQALSVAIQSDDRIVLAGNTVKGFNFSCFDCPANNGFNFALARYNADGSLDTSFGGTGKVITDIGGFSFGGGDGATSVAIQSDGKIVAAGSGNPLASGNQDFALVRYNTNGTLDTSFGGTGKVTTDFGSTTDHGYSVAIQSDGRILVAGESNNDFALARYNADGGLDTTTFGGGTGKVTTNFGGTDRGQSVAIQSDDKIVVAGNTTTPAGFYDFALARYKTDGNLDSTFGAGGKVITDFGGGGPDVGHSVAIQSDAKIVVAGHGGATHTDFAVARYNGTEPPSNSPPLAVAGPDQVVNEGATVQLDASASSDPDNHALTFNWPVVSGTGPTITLSSYTVANPTFSTLDDGVYTLRVTVSDGNGGVASDDVRVTVNNVAPAVNAGADQSLPFGTLVNVSASFTDPGTMDTWTYSIEWGDGSPVATGSATVGSPITGSHRYVVPGNQTITVCVTDDDLGQGCDSLTVTFVNGIGKITGGARFGNNGRGGFNVQSDDGVTVKGEMEYHNGSVNLHARTMTVVAVSPDLKRGSFAGVLEDGRTFVVYVEDNGEPGRDDIFKMWVQGTLLNGDGTLTGGNVQIHK